MVLNLDNQSNEWLVRMSIEGAVNIGNKVTFNDVVLIQRKKWIEASVTVNEVNRDAAENVAIRRLSDVLNALSFISNSSIILVGVELVERNDSRMPVTIKMLKNSEINNWKALDQLNDSDLFRGLGYYRKGLNELDPFDAFLAFWSAIEIICSKSPGNHIGQKISSLAQTHSISVRKDELRALRDTRNRIVHGAKRYDIDQIKYVAEKIPRIKELARAFLTAKLTSPTIPLVH